MHTAPLFGGLKDAAEANSAAFTTTMMGGMKNEFTLGV
jgi:hypothetical protein